MRKVIIAAIILGLLLHGCGTAKTYNVNYSNYFGQASGTSYGTKSFKNSKDEALLKCKNLSEEKNINPEGCLLHDYIISSALDTLFDKEIEKIVWNEEVDKFEKTLKPEDIIEGRRHKIIRYKSALEKKEEKEKDKISSMIDRAKSTCKELGFKEETEKFTDCALKLYTQQADAEAAAKSTNQGQGQTIIVGPPRKLPRAACEASGGLIC